MLLKYEKLAAQVGIKEMFSARRVLNQFIHKTNLIHYPELSRILGAKAFVKHENHNPTGSFQGQGRLEFYA